MQTVSRGEANLTTVETKQEKGFQITKGYFTFGLGSPMYAVICGNARCRAEMLRGGKSMIPYQIKCPLCGYEAKVGFVKRVLSLPKGDSKRMLVVHVGSNAYRLYKNNGEKHVH